MRLTFRLSLFVLVLFALGGFAQPAFAAVSEETAFVFNSFAFLIHGVLVMFMAAGFAMLEAGLVRSKNTAAICLKNIALYSVAGIAFYLVGYNLLYSGVPEGGFIGSFGRRDDHDVFDSLSDGFDVADNNHHPAGFRGRFEGVDCRVQAACVEGPKAFVE